MPPCRKQDPPRFGKHGAKQASPAPEQPQAAPSSGQRRPISRLCCAGRTYQAFFRHRRAGWSSDAITRSEFLLRELLLGVVVCMAQIPESIAFAYLARVRPPVALHSAWIVGLVCALGGGRPGMINGATGAFAAIIATFLEEPEVEGGNGAGIETLFPSVIVAGLLMLGVCYFRLDRFVALLPLPVMIGFCNGLAVVIGRAQLHPFYAPKCDDSTSSAGGEAALRRLSTGPCTASGYKEGAELGWMVLIMLTAMAVMELLPKIPTPTLASIRTKPAVVRPFAWASLALLTIPSSLLAIVAAIALEFCLVRPLGHRTNTKPSPSPKTKVDPNRTPNQVRPMGHHTNTIGDLEGLTAADALPLPFFLDDRYDLAALQASGAWGRVVLQAVLLCAVGCIESLMTAEVVSGFVKTPHHPGLVVGAMGVGNILSGLLGGMGGNAMIGLSTIACLNGGRGRVAPLATALGVLLCVSVAYRVLNFIPMAALAGVMLVVVMHTFKWLSLPMLAAALLGQRARDVCGAMRCGPMCALSLQHKVIRSDVLVMLVVTVLVVMTNIVVAVAVGVGLCAIAFAWESSGQLRVSAYTCTTAPTASNVGTNGPPTAGLVKRYEVEGPLFFAATHRFPDYFTPDSDPPNVVVTFGSGVLFDYTIMDALVALTAAYRAEGKRIEFHALHRRSAKMLRKASALTKHVEYAEAPLTEHRDHSMPHEEAAQYSRQVHAVKARITGLAAPSWTSIAGPGMHALAEVEPLMTIEPKATGIGV